MRQSWELTGQLGAALSTRSLVPRIVHGDACDQRRTLARCAGLHGYAPGAHAGGKQGERLGRYALCRRRDRVNHCLCRTSACRHPKRHTEPSSNYANRCAYPPQFVLLLLLQQPWHDES